MPFGQVVVGPPGSGKTTYCRGLQHYLQASGRKVAIVNLDPANDNLPYEAAVDISDLVCLEEVMEELKLGPNGGLLYCMDYLAKNMDWLHEQLRPLLQTDHYLLLDSPGQVELLSAPGGGSLKRVLDALGGTGRDGAGAGGVEGGGAGDGGGAGGGAGGSSGGGGSHIRLVAVQLVDAHLCTDPSKYLSALLLSLNTMLHLELPHINVLSKMDLVRQYGKLDFNLNFYTEVQDLGYLVAAMGDKPFSNKFRKLSLGLCEVVEEYGLVSFLPLAIQDKASLTQLVMAADKANGYCFATLRGATPYPPELLYSSTGGGLGDRDIWMSVQETYLDGEWQGDIREREGQGEGKGETVGKGRGGGLAAVAEEGEEQEEEGRGNKQEGEEASVAAGKTSEV